MHLRLHTFYCQSYPENEASQLRLFSVPQWHRIPVSHDGWQSYAGLFDELSYQYSFNSEFGKNIHYYNGWKTNKCWIINKKVILPFYDAWNFMGRYDPVYKVAQKLSDIEKALDYLNGSVSDEEGLRERLKVAEKANQTRKIPLRYFTVTFYKRGTCHIEFTNLELLKKLNIFGSQKKGWLPPSYGKKTYKAMSQEEQDVVDSFEGKASYGGCKIKCVS